MAKYLFELYQKWHLFSHMPAVKSHTFFGAAQTKFSPSFFDRALEKSYKQQVLYEFLMKVTATLVV